MPISVSDSLSNADEQMDRAARVIGYSPLARAVFERIYHGKSAVKTVSSIADLTGLTAKQVLTQGKKFVDNHIVEQLKIDGLTAYRKNAFFQRHKHRILSLAGNSKKLAAFPTKRNPGGSSSVKLNLQTLNANATATRITIEDITNFRKVRSFSTNECIPMEISESQFKKGVQKILGEPGTFKDWGGETNDLYSSRLRIAGKRRQVAFGFKGPGTRGSLTPGKMGKNGDQIQRLFDADADVYIIQYWQDIGERVVQQLFQLATAAAYFARKRIWYGVIDGVDSHRLLLAYRDCFNPSKKTQAKAQMKERSKPTRAD